MKRGDAYSKWGRINALYSLIIVSEGISFRMRRRIETLAFTFWQISWIWALKESEVLYFFNQEICVKIRFYKVHRAWKNLKLRKYINPHQFSLCSLLMCRQHFFTWVSLLYFLDRVTSHDCRMFFSGLTLDYFNFLPPVLQGRINYSWTVDFRILSLTPVNSNNFFVHFSKARDSRSANNDSKVLFSSFYSFLWNKLEQKYCKLICLWFYANCVCYTTN